MATVLITGGTGLIGKNLTKHLTAKGYHVIVLTRQHKQKTANEMLSFAGWNINEQKIDIDAIKKADYIINLAGAGVMDKKWTKKYKEEIVKSRIKSGELLVKSLQENDNKVKAVISASAIGWYGEDPKPLIKKEGFKEDYPSDKNFLGDTCRLWENSIEPVSDLQKRLVKLRIGIVLSNEGAAFPEFKKSLNFGIAGILGNGKQVISWIHIDDLCRLFIYAIENENIYGIYNAVAPEPVTNKKMMLQLAEKMRGYFYIPIHIPQFALKIILGERSIEVLKSATVNSDKIKKQGFTFLYPSIYAAMKELIKK
jgi:hypothetical protein